MVFAAFVISSLGVLLALGLIQGAQRATEERGRETLQRQLAGFLDGAVATDREHGSGTYRGIPVTIALGHYEVTFTAQLESAIVPYRELVERHAPQFLKSRLAELDLTVDDKDRVCGVVPREAGQAENLASLANRLPAVGAVSDLRRFAPGELLARIERAHSSADIDQILLQLTQHFPDAPETQDAIDLAAEREHSNPERVRERAQRWLTRA